MNEMKFYQTKWFTFLMLLVFAPVGIYLLWKNKHFNNNTLLVLSIIFGLLFITVINSSDHIESNRDKYNFTSPDEVAETSTPEPTKTPSPTPTPKTEGQLFDEWVKSQFSGWDGSHKALVELVKENMNDPKSFQHAKTTYTIDTEQKSINIHMKYRGKNGFGGLILTSVTAVATYKDNLLKVIETEQ